MATFISHSVSETEAFAEQRVVGLDTGWVIGLVGDLGAGKTQFARGIARGIGVTDRIHSPTFALLNIYETGRVPLYHIDLYRLETHDQIVAAGLEDYILDPLGIAVIEWMDRWQGALPSRFQSIEIETLDENSRRITYDGFGS
ncbi:MAG: tRNA (adenosine(37)-N6)-threonylcarbamoyltransferase complex ATPase subunit type 1 TsaE [Verrucomicrobia bacterium]|nr:tRNA (adenosine(37)-N6)-threonylcarbamoyltransferase complex ATPase subunit type 1 TsaE [Verrucomicrobiota bacterium]